MGNKLFTARKTSEINSEMSESASNSLPLVYKREGNKIKGKCSDVDTEGFCCSLHAQTNMGCFYRVDIAALEKFLGDKPVFSKTSLELFDRLRKHAETHNDDEDSLMVPDLFGNDRYVWRPSVWRPYTKRVIKVGIDYLPIQDLSPKVQECHLRGTHLQTTYKYNEVGAEPEYIPLQMVLHPSATEEDMYPLARRQLMAQFFFKSLAKAKSLWNPSVAARSLEEKFISAAKSSVQVKKIVAFGLGTTYDICPSGKGFSICHIQHLSMITIASALNRVYQAEDPSTPPIEIILQDPAYTKRDWDAWTAEYSNVRFAPNPQGFLAVDSNTLVVNGFLPYGVPLLSICADLLPNGPAGFIHEEIILDPKKRCWAPVECGTPKVVKLLLENYGISNFDDHTVEHEIYHDFYNRPDGFYWLWHMQCFLKPKSKHS